MDINHSNMLLDKDSLNKDCNSLKIEDLQQILNKMGVSKQLYTHPTIVSLLGKFVGKHGNLSVTQLEELFNNIINVSKFDNSFTIMFSDSYDGEFFSYALNGEILVYTKQTFIKSSCIKETHFFDLDGKQISSPKIIKYEIESPSKNEEDLSL